MNLLKLADRGVNGMGLGKHLIHHEPRHFRWISLLALAALIGGAVILLMSVTGRIQAFLPGDMLYAIALVLAAFLQIFGPLRRADARHPLDERERTLRTKAYNFAGFIVAMLAMTGAWIMPLLALFSRALLVNPGFWLTIAWLLSGLFSIIPSLYASWTTRPLSVEAD